MSALTPASVAQSAGKLFEVWQTSWPGLGEDEKSVADIDNAINAMRETTLETILMLD